MLQEWLTNKSRYKLKAHTTAHNESDTDSSSSESDDLDAQEGTDEPIEFDD